MTKETTSKVKRKLKLTRRDGKIVDVIYYNLPSNSYDDLQENIYPYNNAGID